jgi:hypothetical protein
VRISERHQNYLSKIKNNVRTSHDYFRSNYDRYNEFVRFVYESNLTNDEITLLMTMERPQLEFNVLASRIARLKGEFSKQEPDVSVRADDETKADWVTQKVVEQHIRHTLLDLDNHNTRVQVFDDLLSGGFSVLKVFTDYANSMSMDQIIKIERCEPTLCVFDKVTKFSHKGDGRFCAELFPKTKEEFLEEYPDIPVNTISFRRDFGGFQWSYINDNTEILIVADYYEKKKSEKTIVQVRDGKVMIKEDYDKMVEEWDELTVPPAIIGKPRKTLLERIVRYRCIENQVIEYAETDYEMLPLIFVVGCSAMVRTPKNGNVRQVCLPYVYHAKGAQRLKNYAGISLANEIENQMQHKIMIAKEALPKEEIFLSAYKDVQRASTLVFNSVYEENPEMPINNPIREVQRIPAPPEVVQAFMGADSLMEQILGSYDAALGINDNQLSGRAIRAGAMQSNSAAQPYVEGFDQGYNRAFEIYVSLLPKIYTTPRTLPIVDEEGRRNFVKINQEEGVPFDFDSNVLNVCVKTGASFQIQKSETIMMIKEIMGMSPEFANFINSKGLNFVLENMEGKGIDQLKSMVDEWQEEQEKMKQQAMQMQQSEMQNNPALLKQQVDIQKLQLEAQKNEMQFNVDMAKLQNDLQINEQTSGVQLVKALAEKHRANAEVEIKRLDLHHKRQHDFAKLHHEINKGVKHG